MAITVDMTKVEEAVAAGGAAAAALLGFQKQVAALMAQAQKVADMLQLPEIKAVASVAPSDLLEGPATLDDLAGWRATGCFLDNQELRDRHRQMGEAMALENVGRGFMLAVQVFELLGGAAA